MALRLAGSTAVESEPERPTPSATMAYPLVADTAPIIHLDEIDALYVLSTIDHVLLPQTVYDELAAGAVPPAISDIE